MAVLSRCNTWAVGFSGDGSHAETLAEHWDGAAWTVVPSPSPGDEDELIGVSALSAHDIWAVGSFRRRAGGHGDQAFGRHCY